MYMCIHTHTHTHTHTQVITITFALNAPIKAGETVRVYLPSFQQVCTYFTGQNMLQGNFFFVQRLSSPLQTLRHWREFLNSVSIQKPPQ